MPWKELCTMDLKHEFILKALDSNCNFKELCQEYGISRTTGHKWKNRFFENGFSGLSNQSRRPRVSPNETPEDAICEIIRLKIDHKNWGPKKIRALYARNHPHESIPSLSTFNRILDKAGLVRHRKRRNRSTQKRLRCRMKPEQPNDLWTVDFKGWWYTSEKEKCDPLTVRDDYSKYILSLKAVQKAATEEVKQEFERLFQIYGIPKVIRSDNGPPFASWKGLLGLTRLSAWWLSLGIQLDRITPGKPSENGAHERMHGDIKKELQGQIRGGLKEHQNYFDIWKDEYNNVRPHEALEMQSPVSVYTKSETKYNGNIEEILYPLGYISRQVNDRGCITLDCQKVFISYVLKGYNVGLKENNDETMSVWFDNLRLGEIDLRSLKFKPVLTGKEMSKLKGKV